MEKKLLHECGPERLEMEVQHTCVITEHHKLEGNCPKCGEKIETGNAAAIQRFEQGLASKSDHECGALLVVKGRLPPKTKPKSNLILPKDSGKVVVPGRANNRHARRAAPKLVKG